jgi:hypothetical protein
MTTHYELNLGGGELIVLNVITGLGAVFSIVCLFLYRYVYMDYASKVNKGVYNTTDEVMYDAPECLTKVDTLRYNVGYWLAIFRRKYIHRLMNNGVAINLAFGIAANNTIIFVMYVCRVTTIYSDNVSKTWDVAFASILGICILVGFLLYDFFVFKTFSHYAVTHLMAVAAFAISLQSEINGLIGHDEAITFSFVVASVPFVIFKLLAGFIYRAEVSEDVRQKLTFKEK